MDNKVVKGRLLRNLNIRVGVTTTDPLIRVGVTTTDPLTREVTRIITKVEGLGTRVEGIGMLVTGTFRGDTRAITKVGGLGFKEDVLLTREEDTMEVGGFRAVIDVTKVVT
jgi:hypothetical protein